MSFGETETKDCTPLNKMNIAACKADSWFPSIFKFWNQVSRSKEGEETHTERGPEGQLFRDMEVGISSDREEDCKGDLTLASRDRVTYSPDSFEAPSEGWIKRLGE